MAGNPSAQAWRFDLFGQISGPRKLLVCTKYHNWPVNFASSHPTLSSFEITFLFWSILPMFWCCTNTDDDDDTTLPQLHTSEQVLPFSKELTKELKTLERSQTAAKLAKKPSPHFFTIRLDRAPGTSFGLDVSAVGRVCMVNDVHPDSLVGEWNQQCFEAGDLDQAVQQWLRCSDDTAVFPRACKGLMHILSSTTIGAYIFQSTIPDSKDVPRMKELIKLIQMIQML